MRKQIIFYKNIHKIQPYKKSSFLITIVVPFCETKSTRIASKIADDDVSGPTLISTQWSITG